MSDCFVYSLTTSDKSVIITFFSSLVFLYLSVLYFGAKGYRLQVMVHLFFPILDVTTDIYYLMTTAFYFNWLCYLCIVFVSFPIPLFILRLYEESLVPRITVWKWENMWFLGSKASNDCIRSPTFYGDTCALMSAVDHFSCLSLILELLVWFIAIVCQGSHLQCRLCMCHLLLSSKFSGSLLVFGWN